MIDGRPSGPTRIPFSAPMAAPSAIAQGTSSGTGTPCLASQPAATAHTANCEPMEMSICPTRITSVAPMASRSTGELLTARSRRLTALKNDGATAPTPASRAMNTISADSSLL